MDNSFSASALDEFFTECDEIIQRVSTSLQDLEKGQARANAVDQIYRDMHTMKGSAQLFGFRGIGQLAHAMEASLDPIRKQGLSIDVSFADTALKTLDLIDRVVHGLRERKEEKEFAAEIDLQIPILIDEATAMFGADFRIRPDTPVDRGALPAARAERPVAPMELKPAPVAESKPASAVMAPLVQTSVVNEVEAFEPAKKDAETESAELTSAGNSTGTVDSTVRVQVGLLDRLMNLVGELVLVRNQVTQYTTRHDHLEFVNLAQNLSVVTTELQNEVMLTRMQPIGGVVNKFKRVVRDLARDLGKKIDLTIQGADTELDKTLLEAIKDPLTHIVRNACDHGIESAKDRKAAGKPETGHLMIRAFHDGGQILIEVSDDGRGLDRDRIVAKAIERKIITAERAAKMTDREICQIIFLPGFSTASQVTNVSGRGVGMDVVKTNIEKIGGSAEIVSTFQKGSTIRLKIPLTLAIVPVLLVRSGSQRFAIPQVKLVELVRVEGGDQRERIELLQGRPMYRLRGDLLPIVRLNEALKGSKPELKPVTESELENLPEDHVSNIVVLNAEGELFGLLVDEILDTTDIVVKPLGSVLKKIAVFSGATILGDGSVALILDVLGLAESASIDARSKRKAEGFMDKPKSRAVDADAQEMLLVKVGAEAKHAIPLCLVTRLEEFEASQIEVSGAQKVVQYRGGILPIVDLNQALNYKVTEPRERVAIVVVNRGGRFYGIAVEEVLDVITADHPVDDAIRDREGILGNVLVRDELIVVVDAFAILETNVASARSGSTRANLSAVEKLKHWEQESRAQKAKILFAEDVAFFRKQVTKVLTGAGYEVHVVEDGQQALQALEGARDGEFSLVLSDIEMPNKTGLELAKEIRANQRFDRLPLAALTTRFRSTDIEAGKKAGFNAYLEKLNSDVLLETVSALLASRSNGTTTSETQKKGALNG